MRVVDNLSTGQRSNLAHLEGRYEWLEGNVADFAVCRRGRGRAEYVFHEAAIPSVPRSVREPIESHESRPTATLNMLEAARRGRGQAVHVRRLERAYGEAVESPKHEGIYPQPLSPYAAGKLAGEHACLGLCQDDGARRRQPALLQHLRPASGSVGPYSGVISLFVRAMSEGRRPTIFGDGGQTRDYTYVSNVVAANLAALQRNGRSKGRSSTSASAEASACSTWSRRSTRSSAPSSNRISSPPRGGRPPLAGQPRADRGCAGLSPRGRL